jgi:zinc protease
MLPYYGLDRMRRRLLLASPLLAIPAAWSQPAVTADSVLDRYVQVTGGKAARARAKTQFIKTRIAMPAQGIQGTANEYRGDGISYLEMEIPGVGKVEQGVHAGVVWEKSALMGPRLKQGDERYLALRQAALDSDWNWRRYYNAVLQGAVDSPEAPEPSHKVLLTPKEGGSPETRYYSKKSGYLVKMTTRQKSPLGDIAMEMSFSDYRNVGGVFMAFQNTVKAGPQQMEIVQEAVQNNVAIPAAKRVPPADVRLLMARQPAPAAKKQ